MLSIVEKDFGTPKRESTELVTLTIDGQEITVPAGTSVMRAAALTNVKIPKLCATEQLEAFGSCRLCLVQIDGMKGLPASCTTPVAAGMKVTTQNKQLADIRRGVMELYISDHPLDCLTCPANGHCELQDMAGVVGLREVRYGYEGANHLIAEKDTSNPYFTFDASKCIVCSRCVRACDEQQGTLALTIQNRGFDSTVSASQNVSFMDSECVSCGACVQACPTATLSENTLIEMGQAEHSITTTCAYCGVGCSFRAEMKGEEVVRMVPNMDGHANHGHSCVKGRFAIGYATHSDRIVKPMIRAKISDPWKEVSWEEAIAHAASELKRIQAKYGRDSIGAITSSRCSNEETYLVQKLVRAGFGNNNVDTCARVCHSPTGYGLKNTLGESAGTQNFDSVMKADVIFVIGANPTDGHPVFASQMKRRLRQGAKLIVADPRRIDLVRTPHIEAEQHLKLRPGTNVALMNSLAHVIVTEGLVDEEFVRARCEAPAFEKWRTFIAKELNSPETMEAVTGGHGYRQYRPRRGGCESSARAEQCAGILRHGFLPARVPRLPPRLGRCRSPYVRKCLGRGPAQRAWLAHSQYVRSRTRRRVQGSVHRGRRHRAIGSEYSARDRCHERHGMHHRPGFVLERIGEVRSCVSAGLFVPREGRHLHQCRTAHLARSQSNEAEVRLFGLGNNPAAVERGGLPDELFSPIRNHG
jgi:formate dehydrogenase major subunit